jgi:ATP-dependent DNA helicase RecQ
MLEKMLEKHFGYTTFRRGQKEIINDLLSGLDVLAMLPTGSGKSLCYQLPGYCLAGPVVIVSPLLSLMEDQVQTLKSFGEKRVIALNSFLAAPKKRKALQQLSAYRFIFVSPEVLQNVYVLRALKQAAVSLFVIDEAHCISQWGHEFRTDYLKLKDVLQTIGRPPCLALTATATKDVQRDIAERLQLKAPERHIYSVDRPNIGIYVEHVQSTEEKMAKIVETAKRLEPPGIIYFSSRNWTERFSAHLKTEGIVKTAYYHGGLEVEERLLIQQQFLDDELDVICCTNAFGMGINKANIRFVVHFHYPKQIEYYLQEIGRAGRDGKKSLSLLFYEDGDHEFPAAMIDREFPDHRQLRESFAVLSEKRVATESETKEIFEQTGMSETAGRFLTHQLETFEVMKEGRLLLEETLVGQVRMNIQEHIEKRKRVKFQKLIDMQQWLQSTMCRRSGYLAMFQEQLDHRPKKCCDVCGLTTKDYIKTRLIGQKHNAYLWKEDLRCLLHQSGESHES